MEKEELARSIESARVSMLRLALSITRRGSDAEDAVSAAIVAAFEKRLSLRNVERVKPWLLTITARKAQDVLRGRSRVTPMENLPEEPIFREDLTRTVFGAIRELSPSYREILTLYYYDGYDAGEIASILRMSRTTVFMRLSRGRKQLKAALEEGEAGYESI